MRLFKELEARNRDLAEALEQQTATSEILRVISRSPTNVTPVFQVIVEHARRLCDRVFANVIRLDGGLMHNMAQHGFSPEAEALLGKRFPMPPSQGMSGRAILARAVVHAEVASSDAELGTSHDLAQLTEALEQQTATSNILRVISQSQTEVQPIFDTIVRSAVRLCAGLFSALYRSTARCSILLPSTTSPPKASTRCVAYSPRGQPGAWGQGGRSSIVHLSTYLTSSPSPCRSDHSDTHEGSP